MTNQQRWAPALFSHFGAREREAKKERKSAKKKERESAKKKERESAKKKERESAKKKEREKSESAEGERKKREFALFSPPTVKIRFQSPKPLGRGKARVLSKIVQ